MIGNCGVLGLDWERASLSAYLEAMDAHGGEDDRPPAEISNGHRKFMRAHGLTN